MRHVRKWELSSLLAIGIAVVTAMSGASLAPAPASAASPGSVPATTPLTDDLVSHSVGKWGIDLGDRDPAVKPGDDFYLSQNGGWYARTELNASLPMAAYWRDLRRLAPRRLIAILDEVSADRAAPPGSVE